MPAKSEPLWRRVVGIAMAKAAGGRLASLFLLLVVEATWEERASASNRPLPWRLPGGNSRVGVMGGVGIPPMPLYLRGGYGKKSVESRAAARRLIYREQYMRERELEKKAWRAKKKELAKTAEEEQKIENKAMAEAMGGDDDDDDDEDGEGGRARSLWETGLEDGEDWVEGEVVDMEGVPLPEVKRGVIIPVIRNKSLDWAKATDDEILGEVGEIKYSPMDPLEKQLERLRVPQFDTDHIHEDRENATENLVCLEQWFGKEAVYLHEKRMDEIRGKVSTNVTERTRELVQQVVGGGKNVPQVGAVFRACEMVANWENKLAITRAMKQDIIDLNKFPDSNASSESEDGDRPVDLLGWRLQHEGKKVDEKFLDARGRLLPPGYERVEPIPIDDEEWNKKHPEVMEKMMKGEMPEMLLSSDVISQMELDRIMGETQEAYQIMIDYIEEIAGVYEECKDLTLATKYREVADGLRLECGLVTKGEDEWDAEKAHKGYMNSMNAVLQGRLEQKRKEREIRREADEWKKDKHTVVGRQPMLDGGDPDKEQSNIVLSRSDAMERIRRIEGSQQAVKGHITAGAGGFWRGPEPFYEEGDSDYERWLGGPETLANLPPNVKLTEDGPVLKSFGLENTEPPGLKDCVRREHRARQEQHAFSVRHVHMAKGEAQKLHNARQVLAWGGNTCGQLGVGNDVDQPYPLSIPSFRQSSKWHGRIVDAWIGAWHSFVHLSEPNELIAFGYNKFGQLGLGLLPKGPDSYPNDINLDDPTPEVESLMQDAFGPSWRELHEEVKASGLTDMRADIGNIHEPISVPSLKGKRILSAACGAFHSLFLVEGDGDDVGGRVYAAGLNKRGQMGLGHFDIRHTHRVPTLVSSLEADCDVISVHCGWQYSAVLARDGNVFAFGSDQHGQFGFGEEKSGADLPAATLIHGPKMGSKRVKAISCGFSHIILAYEGGGVASAGCNDHGQLGRGSVTPKCCEFEEIESFRGLEIESVACGHEHSIVLLKNGSAYGFGKCQQGQLGVQSRDDEPLGVHGHNKKDDGRMQIPVWPNPVKIFEDEELKTCGKVTSVACGLDHTVVTVAGGQVLVCGDSANGQVGLGSTAACFFPLDVHGMRGKRMRVVAGGNHNLAWGCENGYSNKIRKIHSVWSSEPYMRDAEYEQYERWVEGLGPRPSVSVPELHIATGENWIHRDLEPQKPGSQPYDDRAAEEGASEASREEDLVAIQKEMRRTKIDNLPWGKVLKASSLNRVRYRTGGYNNPDELQDADYGTQESLKLNMPEWSTSMDEDYALGGQLNMGVQGQGKGPWWLKRELWGEDAVDGTKGVDDRELGIGEEEYGDDDPTKRTLMDTTDDDGDQNDSDPSWSS